MTDKKLSTVLIEKYDDQSWIMKNMDIMFSGAHGQKIWYGSFFFDALLLLWAPWIFAVPYVIQDCFWNFLWAYWKYQGIEKQRDEWYSTFNTSNWRWFWRVQKHRVNYNVNTSYDKDKDMCNAADFLSKLKKRDWMAYIEQPPKHIPADPIVYVSFRKRKDAIHYKMLY